MNELEFIRKLTEKTLHTDSISAAIGDDTAILEAENDSQILVTTDMLMDGVHFQIASQNPKMIGHKSLAVSLSDIAAMAGRPFAAFMSVALPKDSSEDWLRQFTDGLLELAGKFETTLAGGDTNFWQGPLVVNITLLGKVKKGEAIRRSGARPGDRIFVTGSLGGSLKGRHLNFMPRVKEALALKESYRPTAMIDISDGLASDLRHICEQSRCGALIDRQKIPISTDVDSEDPFKSAMTDGEDFELCFCLPWEDAERLKAQGHILTTPVVEIGEIVDEKEIFYLDQSGKQKKLKWQGYVHH